MRKRAFISHAHAQAAWAKALHRNLERVFEAGSVFLDQRDIAPGTSFVSALESGLEKAEKLVLVATPEALASPWVSQEVNTAQADALGAVGGRILVLRLVDTPLPPFLDALQPIDFYNHDDAAYRAGFAALVQALRGAQTTSEPYDDLMVPAWPAPIVPVALRERILQLLAAELHHPVCRVGFATVLGIDHRLFHEQAQRTDRCAASALLVHGVAKTRDDLGSGGDEPGRTLRASAETLRRLRHYLLAPDGAERLDQLVAEIEAEIAKTERKRPAKPAPPSALDVYLRLVADQHHRPDWLRRRAALADLERLYVPLSLDGEHGRDLPRDAAGALAEGALTLDRLLRLDPAAHPLATGRWAVIGDPGAGKTTQLRRLARDLAAAGGAPWIPLYLRLPRWLGKRRGPFADALDLVAETGTAIEGFEDTLRRAAQAGELLFLLDGLDEVDTERRPRAVRQLHALARDFRAPLVVTSRRVGYEPLGGDFAELAVLPFDRGQRRSFLTTWFETGDPTGDGPPEARADTLLKRLEPDRGLWQLAGNPLSLTLIALLVDAGRTVVRGRATLFRDVLSLLVRGEHRPADEPIANPALVREVLRDLAEAFTEANVDGEDAAALERRLWQGERSAELEQLSRWQGRLDVFLRDVAERTNILADQGGGDRDSDDGAWTFWHRTFREALVAERLGDLHGAEGPEAVIARAATVGGNLSAWGEAYALLAGEIDAPDALISALVQARPDVGYRALASATAVGPAVVAEVLTLTDDWQERAAVYQTIHEKVGDPETALHLLDRLRRERRNGNDLYFLEQAVRTLRDAAPAVAARADELLARFFDHIPPPPAALFESIETRDRGAVPLLVELEPGSFTMGDDKGQDNEKPAHRVEIGSGFHIACVPVTNAQYQAFDNTFEPQAWKDVEPDDLPRHPAVNVSWYAAVAFCRWLSKAVPGFRGARLPSEEEWEYACRAGSPHRYWSGDDESDLEEVGWYRKNSELRTHRVAQKAANEWELYDVHGNVWEWTASLYTADEYTERRGGHRHDPAGYRMPMPADAGDPSRGASRVLRGGSWNYDADFARAAYRVNWVPRIEFWNWGFRVVVPLAVEGRS